MLSHLLPFIIISPPLTYGLFTLYCARNFFARNKPRTVYEPPVTILKPVKGVDAESYDNFASFCLQDYPSHQIVFALASSDDPAIPVIRKLMGEFHDLDIDLVVDGRIHGPNFKVSNLMNAYPRVKHDIIIVCDSDIRVGRNYLREVCAPFAAPGVGLVTSLYRSPGIHGAATAIEAMGFTIEMVPNVMVALQLEGLSFALGASMAVRRKALEKIGGFAALVDYLADDYQLGNRVHMAGYRLELSSCFVESIMQPEKLGAVLSRQLRWARTMRVSRPGGYFAAGITYPFPAALLALCLSSSTGTGIAACLLLYGVRCGCAIIFSRCFLQDGIFPGWLWLLPLRDCLAFITWVLSFLGNRVFWRGHRYQLLSGGRIVEVVS